MKVLTDFDQKLLKLGACKGVISLIYPETTQIQTKLWKSNPLDLYTDSYLDKQDPYHIDFFHAWLKWSSPVLKLNRKLTHFYPTAGSSEAIRDAICYIVCRSLKDKKTYKLHVFEGDYEGFRAYANAFNVPLVVHNRDQVVNGLFSNVIDVSAGDVFMLSQPSSIDGNIWQNFSSFMTIMEKKHPQVQVMIDICYVGTIAGPYKINLDYKNIQAVFFSLSKAFGVYYHRIGGVLSRSEIPSLNGNKWFKNIFSLKFGEALLKNHSVFELPQKYKKVQMQSLQGLIGQIPNLNPSDVVLLANKPALENRTPLETYLMRANNLRVCLTPKMDWIINK